MKKSSHGLPSVFLPLFALACLLPASVRAGDEDLATVIATRPPKWGGSAGNIWVYVNGKYLGAVANGGKERFTFRPSADGVNTVHVGWYLKKSPSQQMILGPGGEAEFDIDGAKVELSGLTVTRPGNLPPDRRIEGKGALGAITLDQTLKSVVLKESPPIRLARGTEKVVEDSVKVHHSVTITDTWRVDKELQAKVNAIWVEVAGGIKYGIEKSTSKTYGVETERKRSVTIKGDGSAGAVKIVWVEYYRTGTAAVKVDGKEVQVPFQFREDFDLLTRDAD